MEEVRHGVVYRLARTKKYPRARCRQKMMRRDERECLKDMIQEGQRKKKGNGGETRLQGRLAKSGESCICVYAKSTDRAEDLVRETEAPRIRRKKKHRVNDPTKRRAVAAVLSRARDFIAQLSRAPSFPCDYQCSR